VKVLLQKGSTDCRLRHFIVSGLSAGTWERRGGAAIRNFRTSMGRTSTCSVTSSSIVYCFAHQWRTK
jgi:hypothetical protein